MLEHVPRSIERIVEEQARRWAFKGRESADAPRQPVITVSRQHGAGGRELARRLAEELRLDFFDHEIITRIAESAHLSDLVVSTLDERDRKALTDFLAGFASDEYMSPGSYREHLTRVIAAIGAHGGAVVLGRGAHLILGAGKALRVLVVAPLADRVAEIARREALSEREARIRIDAVDATRRAFLAKHFHVDSGDVTHFDLVVNTGVVGISGALAALRGAAAMLPREVLRPGA